MRNKLVLGVLLLAATAALAEVVYDSNRPITSAPAYALASPLSSADASTYDTPLRPRLTNTNTKVVLAPTWSSQGATACFEVLLYQRVSSDTFATIALVQTMTADGIRTIGGRFCSSDGYLVAPTLGCQVVDVRLRSISAGNVTWKEWGLGSDSSPMGTANQ